MQEKYTVEICARAAGYAYKGKVGENFYVYDPITEHELLWNPCLRDKDAFDLMVRANIQVKQVDLNTVSGVEQFSHISESNTWMNEKKKWRACICRVACEMVKLEDELIKELLSRDVFLGEYKISVGDKPE